MVYHIVYTRYFSISLKVLTTLILYLAIQLSAANVFIKLSVQCSH